MGLIDKIVFGFSAGAVVGATIYSVKVLINIRQELTRIADELEVGRTKS